MKPPKILDKAIVAALLLAYVPGLAEDMLPVSDPPALIASADQTDDAPAEEEHPASGLSNTADPV